jgi:hypothetical protein
MNAQEFLTTLERRGFKVGLSATGALTIAPSFGLTGDDRATIKEVGAALNRLLRERESRLSSAEARTINRAREVFEVKEPTRIQRPEPRQPRTHNWPPLEDEPATQPTDHNKENHPMPSKNAQPPLPLATSGNEPSEPEPTPDPEPGVESDDELEAAYDRKYPDSAQPREAKINIMKILRRIQWSVRGR